jgi:hypothetical protein
MLKLLLVTLTASDRACHGDARAGPGPGPGPGGTVGEGRSSEARIATELKKLEPGQSVTVTARVNDRDRHGPVGPGPGPGFGQASSESAEQCGRLGPGRSPAGPAGPAGSVSPPFTVQQPAGGFHGKNGVATFDSEVRAGLTGSPLGGFRDRQRSKITFLDRVYSWQTLRQDRWQHT